MFSITVHKTDFADETVAWRGRLAWVTHSKKGLVSFQESLSVSRCLKLDFLIKLLLKYKAA